jgi:hypothetical protein
VHGPVRACFTPGTPGGGEITTPLLPPVPPVFVLAGWFTGGTGGKSEVIRNQGRNFRLMSDSYLGAHSARSRVGVVAATGTELGFAWD